MATPLVFRLQEGGPELVREVLLERGWDEYNGRNQEAREWNLYWRASPFRNSDYENLLPWQRLNHHPKTIGITRKDCLARNLRRMKATFGAAVYDFSPTAFILPNDYARFLVEYSKPCPPNAEPHPAYWICKPVGLSRGRGIFIFRDLRDLVYHSSVIVQRYISDPLLISGYKFDLRIYACVKSFHPLTIYMHQEGLVRFATEKYNLSSLGNIYSHLTNTSINKFGPFYDSGKESVGQGCTWTMSKFRSFLQSQEVNELLLWQRINSIVTLTLLAIAPSVPSSPNCVELFGFDILLDSKYKPWLLEVNYSPALSLDCQVDVAVKKGLVGDLVDLMNYQSADSLRERAYQRPMYKWPCYLSSQTSEGSKIQNRRGSSQTLRKPVCDQAQLPNKDRNRQSTHAQTSSQMKRICQRQPNKRISHSRSSLHSLLTDHQRKLPLCRVHPASCSIINTKTPRRPATKAHAHPILNPRFRSNTTADNTHTCRPLASCLTDNRAFQRFGVTRCDNKSDSRTAKEPRGSSMKPELGLACQRETRIAHVKGPSKLPDICSARQGPLKLLWDEAKEVEQKPPQRVGNFILTFPFNNATLRASRNTLDLKTIMHEVFKLIGQLALGHGQSERTQKRQEKKGKKGNGFRKTVSCGDQEEFETLFWGPKDPPLLRECCCTPSCKPVRISA